MLKWIISIYIVTRNNYICVIIIYNIKVKNEGVNKQYMVKVYEERKK